MIASPQSAAQRGLLDLVYRWQDTYNNDIARSGYGLLAVFATLPRAVASAAEG